MPIDSISMCSNTLHMSNVEVGSSFEATTICLWTGYQCAQTLCICLIWIWESLFEVAVCLNHEVTTSY